ncbi:MAG: gliding motility lipoprotein GldH [Saprospiraceae bacterium]
MSKKHLFYCLFFASLFLTSCGENYLFEKTYEIEKAEWRYNNTLDYTFEITDTTKVYNLLLEVGHSVEYAYQNCYFKIYTQFPSGEKTAQLLSIDLADGIGRWQGDCDSKSCSILLDIQKQAFFNTLGKHTITLEQYMRKDPLKGIESLAIKLEDTGLSR